LEEGVIGQAEMMNAIVLGIGNPLLGDDGFGVEVARRLREAEKWNDVEIIDGGSQGLYLLPYLQGRTHIIVADAVDFGGEPGQIACFSAEQVPARLSLKMSEHQVTFHEVLALMRLLGERPKEFLFFGVEPRSNEWGDGLSKQVGDAVDPVVARIRDQIKTWRQADGTDERHSAAE
jgi:hydrogenase maturation protease